MEYCAVILSYLRDPLPAVSSILKQKPPPGKVVVWHNAPSVTAVPGVLNIFCEENLGCSIRQTIGLHFGFPATVFMDDDIRLRDKGVLTRLISFMNESDYDVVGYKGRDLKFGSDKPYTEGRNIGSGEADVVKGFLCAVRTRRLESVMAYTLLDDDVRMEDDIVMSSAITIQTGKRHGILSFEKGCIKAEKLPHGNCSRKDHYQRRDMACLKMINAGWGSIKIK